MKQEHFRLTPEQEEELRSLAEMSDDDIDLSDIPEKLDWSGAKRGVFYRGTTPTTTDSVLTDTTESGRE